jgi:hypothetical protein
MMRACAAARPGRATRGRPHYQRHQKALTPPQLTLRRAAFRCCSKLEIALLVHLCSLYARASSLLARRRPTRADVSGVGPPQSSRVTPSSSRAPKSVDLASQGAARRRRVAALSGGGSAQGACGASPRARCIPAALLLPCCGGAAGGAPLDAILA